MADTTNDSAASQEPPPPASDAPQPTQQRRSSIGKVVDAIKKPFHHEKEPTPPALQEAIQKMEQRKEHTAHRMEDEGKDTALLSGKRKDLVKQLT